MQPTANKNAIIALIAPIVIAAVLAATNKAWRYELRTVGANNTPVRYDRLTGEFKRFNSDGTIRERETE